MKILLFGKEYYLQATSKFVSLGKERRGTNLFDQYIRKNEALFASQTSHKIYLFKSLQVKSVYKFFLISHGL